MKRLFVVITIIAIAFCLVCCDAEKIANTGKNLSKIGNVNAGYADAILEELLDDVTVVLDYYLNNLGLDPIKGNMDPEKVEAIVGVINMAKESSASAEAIAKILDQEAKPVSQDSKRNIQVKEVADEFLASDPAETREELTTDLSELLGGIEGITDMIESALSDENFDKVKTVVNNIYPAIDALQSIIDQSLSHEGYVTYGDVIANTIFRNTVYSVVKLVANGSEATTEEKMNVVDTVINNLYALEVIYGVTFDVPQIAGNFVGNL